MGDEQYESEEDDHTARRFSLPASISTTGSGAGMSGTLPSTNNPPYNMPSRAADRYAEVDALFAKHFPHVQLSSRYGAPQAQAHRHSYPQQPVLPQLHPAYPHRYSQQDIPVPAGAAQGSPLLTPPTSYPLPPAREDKSGSMSPLTLEGVGSSRRGSAAPVTAAAQQASVGLGMALGDAGVGSVGGGGFLLDEAVDVGAQGGYLTGSGASASMMPAVDFAAAVAGDPSWYTSSDGLPSVSGGWHNRSLSLPSALEQFQFDVDTAPATTTTAGVGAAVPASALLIDPAILPSAVPPAPASAEGTRAVTATPPNEPWADWVNLDGDGPQPLGVKV
jgi:hypothetical protein